MHVLLHLGTDVAGDGNAQLHGSGSIVCQGLQPGPSIMFSPQPADVAEELEQLVIKLMNISPQLLAPAHTCNLGLAWLGLAGKC